MGVDFVLRIIHKANRQFCETGTIDNPIVVQSFGEERYVVLFLLTWSWISLILPSDILTQF